MIGKVSRGSSFGSTLRYVMGAKKKAKVIFANFAEAFQSDIDAIVSSFTNQAVVNSRVKKPVYHLSISPAIDDALSDSDWAELAEGVLEKLEMVNHQAIAVMHRDTYFPNTNKLRKHLHIVANAVGDNAKCANFLLRLFQNRRLSQGV